MRVDVDNSACTGPGQCNLTAPEVYDLDDEGYRAIKAHEVPAELHDAARQGAESCPKRAITVTG